jgi:hypothetical protein
MGIKPSSLGCPAYSLAAIPALGLEKPIYLIRLSIMETIWYQVVR